MLKFVERWLTRVLNDVLDARELRVRNYADACAASIQAGADIIRCGRHRDHTGAHEFRWQP